MSKSENGLQFEREIVLKILVPFICPTLLHHHIYTYTQKVQAALYPGVGSDSVSVHLLVLRL
jgi:hypothetical protein